MHDQLGLQVKEIKPVGLAGSGGSTPLRLCVAGEPNDQWLFAKLYAKSHVRSDRWYKLWRTILYGRLEDETSFQTVRRFVEYEDHMLRLLRDAGIRVPEAYGIVEITPEREYMLVTEFFDGAVEIGEAELDDDLIDQGLRLIRQLWDAGIAHRDIKPANLMVRDNELLVIDVFFVQVRPSPWREAVDLGNMLLVLALRTDPDRVYQRALAFFTPDELSEAIAASRGVASPTQLRQFMKRDGRDLLGRFRELAPARAPIAIQRWSVRRVALAVMMLLVIAIAVTGSIQLFLPVQNLDVNTPACGTGRPMILMAQAVPSATRLPCVASVPIGWHFINGSFRTGRASFWFGLENSDTRFLTVTLSPACDVSKSEAVPSQFAGVQRYELAISVRPRLETIRSYVFRGGCVTYALSAPASGAADQTGNDLITSGDAALTLMPRATWSRTWPASITSCCAAPPCGAGLTRTRVEHALLATPRRDVTVVIVLALVDGRALRPDGDVGTARPHRCMGPGLPSDDAVGPRVVAHGRGEGLQLPRADGGDAADPAGDRGLPRVSPALVALRGIRLGDRRLRGLHRDAEGAVRPGPAARCRWWRPAARSFPSGHAVAASVTAVAAVIALFPEGRNRYAWGAAAAAFSGLMALSRAYLAAHWLSDAIAGVLLGTSCALVMALVVHFIRIRRRGVPRAGGVGGTSRGARIPARP